MPQTEIKPAVRQEWPFTWEPFSALTRMRESMDQMLTDLFHNFSTTEAAPGLTAWCPALDMYRSGDNLIVELSLPGLKSNEIDIQVEHDQLTVKGEYRHAEEKKAHGVIRSERAYGNFHRSVRLPYPIKSDHVKAKLDNGILKVTMPLAQPEVHKSTTVKVD